jgi:hypothetical protein
VCEHLTGRNTGIERLRTVKLNQIQKKRAVRRRPAPSGKLYRYINTDLVAANADGRPNRHEQLFRRAIEFPLELSDRVDNNRFGRAAPTRVYGSHHAFAGSGHQDWHAIGGPDLQPDARPAGNHGVTLPHATPAVADGYDGIGMNLA